MNPGPEDPIYSQEERLNTLATVTKEDIAFWQSVKQCRNDFDTGDYHGPYGEPSVESFIRWIDKTYGIKLFMVDLGNIHLDYKIIDEQKYTLFVLKYTK